MIMSTCVNKLKRAICVVIYNTDVFSVDRADKGIP